MYRNSLLVLLVSIAMLSLGRLVLVIGAMLLATLRTLLIPMSMPQALIESVLLFALAAAAAGFHVIGRMDYASD